MKIIFMGTPSFAVPSLEALVASKEHEVVAVVTQPEKESGRGKKVLISDVEKCAIKHNLPVYKFNKIRKEGISVLSQIDADVIVTCAYGQILNQSILEMKKHGVINVHGSILPYYRGASPIQWTVINGDEYAGVSIMKSFIGIDDGDVYKIAKTKVLENETSEELFLRLSEFAPLHLIEVLDSLENGEAVLTPQNHSVATHCKKLTKEMSDVSFEDNFESVINLINGINMWPVCKIRVDGQVIKVYKAGKVSDNIITNLSLNINDYKNGEVVVSNSKQGLIVKAEGGFIDLLVIQAENSKKMPAKSYLNGKKINIGSIINE